MTLSLMHQAIYVLILLALLPTQGRADRRVLERYERQLNNAHRRMNRGNSMVVNGKVKRFRCVEEYVFVDAFGNIVEGREGPDRSTSSSIENALKVPPITSVLTSPRTSTPTSTTTASFSSPVLTTTSATFIPEIYPPPPKARAAGLPIKKLEERFESDGMSKRLNERVKASKLLESSLSEDYLQYENVDEEVAGDFPKSKELHWRPYKRFSSMLKRKRPLYSPRHRDRFLHPIAHEDSSFESDRAPYGWGNSISRTNGTTPPAASNIPCFRSGEGACGRNAVSVSQRLEQPPYSLAAEPKRNTTTYNTPELKVVPLRRQTVLDPRLQMTPENCQKLMSYSRIFGVPDPRIWVRNNCHFIQTFVHAPCAELNVFVDSCFPEVPKAN